MTVPSSPQVTADPRGESTHVCVLMGWEQCHTLEVYDHASTQSIFCMSIFHSICFQQMVVTATEVMWSLLLLSGLGGHCRDAVKSCNCRLSSQLTIKQVFFITALGTPGISPPNVHTKQPVISG